MAEVLDNDRAGFMSHIYWENLEDTKETFRRKKNQDETEPDCVIT
jgi:hypothetical protein